MPVTPPLQIPHHQYSYDEGLFLSNQKLKIKKSKVELLPGASTYDSKEVEQGRVFAPSACLLPAVAFCWAVLPARPTGNHTGGSGKLAITGAPRWLHGLNVCLRLRP